MTMHVLDQLSLWVEGDLGAAEMAAIDRHLAECPACHTAAQRLRISQAWLRDALAPPSSVSDEGAWHRAVMAQIHLEAAAKPIRRLAIRRGLLAASAASLLLATLIRRREHVPVASPPLVTASALPAGPAIQTAPVISGPMARHDPARAAPMKVPLHRPKEPVSSPIEGPARIEFQTADPNIRIIWLARATPLPDTNPSLQEEP